MVSSTRTRVRGSDYLKVLIMNRVSPKPQKTPSTVQVACSRTARGSLDLDRARLVSEHQHLAIHGCHNISNGKDQGHQVTEEFNLPAFIAWTCSSSKAAPRGSSWLDSSLVAVLCLADFKPRRRCALSQNAILCKAK